MFGLKKRRSEKQIFRYFDGKKERGADPIKTFRAILSHPKFNLQEHMASLMDDGPSADTAVQTEASQIAVDSVREIFGLTGWSEDTPDGLTEIETLEVLADFIIYMDGLKKNGNGQPT